MPTTAGFQQPSVGTPTTRKDNNKGKDTNKRKVYNKRKDANNRRDTNNGGNTRNRKDAHNSRNANNSMNDTNSKDVIETEGKKVTAVTPGATVYRQQQGRQQQL